jgi:hypothetical protein
LVRCENGAKEDLEIINGIDHYLQTFQDGRDEELAFFPGGNVARAIEDSKRLKLCKMVPGMNFAGYQVIRLV